MKDSSHGRHRKRCKRWDVPYGAHYLTFSCYQQRPFLTRDRTRRWFLDALERARAKHGFHLWAGVIMPEHAHLVVWIPTEARISDILKSIKSSVSRRAMYRLRTNAPHQLAPFRHVLPDGRIEHRFWQAGGGYERLLRSNRDVREKIRYVHENPVRRGLVNRAEDWPWSGHRAYMHGCDEPEPISLDREHIPVVVEFH
ncbi:MAG: REP-associated tyrosine transposase [Planctomycetota bacterium]